MAVAQRASATNPAPSRRPIHITSQLSNSHRPANPLASRLFERRQPVRSMNAVQHPDLERVFPIGRFHRALPAAVEFVQHLFGGSTAAIDGAIQRFQVPALVAAEMIEMAAPPQTLMGELDAFL